MFFGIVPASVGLARPPVWVSSRSRDPRLSAVRRIDRAQRARGSVEGVTSLFFGFVRVSFLGFPLFVAKPSKSSFCKKCIASWEISMSPAWSGFALNEMLDLHVL